MTDFTFDMSHKPNRENVTEEVAAMMDRAFYKRRPLGMNVQFINEDGLRDEWSFNSVERAEAFADKIRRSGLPVAISA
jgi:hypothetical protein